MNKLIVVLGATGGQGGSVVDSFLQAPGWKVRGLTRNASSEKATALKAKGVEMVQGNTDDQTSLEAAFQGAHAIFAFTDYYDYFFELGPERSMARETAQGSNIARAAATIPTLERFVWSTLPNTQLFTEGQAIVPHFQGKANVDVYIKEHLPELYAKTTFTVFTIFGANVVLYDIFRPLYLVSIVHRCTGKSKWLMHSDSPLHRSGYSFTQHPHRRRILQWVITGLTAVSSFAQSWKTPPLQALTSSVMWRLSHWSPI